MIMSVAEDAAEEGTYSYKPCPALFMLTEEVNKCSLNLAGKGSD